MSYAIFAPGKPRVLHAVNGTAIRTVCGLDIGRGTGMRRDGNYAGSEPCKRGCWPAPGSAQPREHLYTCRGCGQATMGESMRLFEPAPNQIPGQLDFAG